MDKSGQVGLPFGGSVKHVPLTGSYLADFQGTGKGCLWEMGQVAYTGKIEMLSNPR